LPGVPINNLLRDILVSLWNVEMHYNMPSLNSSLVLKFCECKFGSIIRSFYYDASLELFLTEVENYFCLNEQVSEGITSRVKEVIVN
jgi:hypothetical protein